MLALPTPQLSQTPSNELNLPFFSDDVFASISISEIQLGMTGKSSESGMKGEGGRLVEAGGREEGEGKEEGEREGERAMLGAESATDCMTYNSVNPLNA